MDNTHHNVIVATSLTGIGEPPLDGYLAHVYCHQGSCRFRYNGRTHVLSAGDCLITRRGDLMEERKESPDFSAEVIYVTPEFIQQAIPQSNYGAKGGMLLFNDPVIHLTPEQQERCKMDFSLIKMRLVDTGHHFQREALINAVQCMIIDFYDFHSQQNSGETVTSPYASLMDSFMELLDAGEYRCNREIGYYADKLCVTPKYLSEVSKKVSGFPANYWIIRYTTLDILRELRDKSKTIKQLADEFHFPSASYFNRYVQKYIGAKPGELRE